MGSTLKNVSAASFILEERARYIGRLPRWNRGVASGWRPRAPASTYARSQQLEVAYQQTAGAIAGLYEFAPQEEESEVAEVAENGQAPELELAEA